MSKWTLADDEQMFGVWPQIKPTRGDRWERGSIYTLSALNILVAISWGAIYICSNYEHGHWAAATGHFLAGAGLLFVNSTNSWQRVAKALRRRALEV